MENRPLAGLQPESVFSIFEQICAIPHGSRNTRQISDWLVDYGRKLGIRCIQDAADNVIFFGPGTRGLEDHPPVILQGHMDMVCEKDPGCPIDMATQGLDVTHDGQFVFARGTTLGGDDGIAVAIGLAILSDPTIAHPPLEVVITANEEIGLLGAVAIDMSPLQGRRLINLDSEDEGIFTVSCAGGSTSAIAVPVERREAYGPCVRLAVDGLRGGHSGAEIHKNRANANKVMGELLGKAQAVAPLRLVSLAGGNKDNAIPRSCTATAVLEGGSAEALAAVAAQVQAWVRESFDEPEATVQAFAEDAPGGNALTDESTAKVIGLLRELPNGVQAWSKDIPGLVQTSLNIGIVKLGDQFRVTGSVRSSVNAEKDDLLNRLKAIGERFGGSFSYSGAYPAWEYRKDSALRDTMVQVYTDMFGHAPQVLAIHAGLECGLFSKKLPDLDCVSIGPQMHDIHTSREKLDIASVGRTWRFLLKVLENL